jgi:hypothetical protein
VGAQGIGGARSGPGGTPGRNPRKARFFDAQRQKMRHESSKKVNAETLLPLTNTLPNFRFWSILFSSHFGFKRNLALKWYLYVLFLAEERSLIRRGRRGVF